jgi:hypothetical protein
MDKLNYLLHITKLEAQDMKCGKLRAVFARWKNNTAYLSYYFDGEVTDEERDLGSDASAQIIANFPDAELVENYIRLDFPQPLPDEYFLAYKQV